MYAVDPAKFEAHKKTDKVTEKKSSKEVCSSSLLLTWLFFSSSQDKCVLYSVFFP